MVRKRFQFALRGCLGVLAVLHQEHVVIAPPEASGRLETLHATARATPLGYGAPMVTLRHAEIGDVSEGVRVVQGGEDLPPARRVDLLQWCPDLPAHAACGIHEDGGRAVIGGDLCRHIPHRVWTAQIGGNGGQSESGGLGFQLRPG